MMFEFHQILMRENDRQNILIGEQNVLIGQLFENEQDPLQITKKKEGKIKNMTNYMGLVTCDHQTLKDTMPYK